MRTKDFRAWLKSKNRKTDSIADIISHLKQIEQSSSNLDDLFADDNLERLLNKLTIDEDKNKNNKTSINLPELQNVVYSPKMAVVDYQQFCQDKPPSVKSFRHNASFGKRMEFWVIGEMLRRGFDVYIPLVDDRGVDAVVRRSDGSFVEVQIKARSNDVAIRDAALFAAIAHVEERDNYWFIFYSTRLNITWILSSKEFITEATQNKNGKNIGKRSIWFNGCKTNKETGEQEEYALERFNQYICNDFSRLNSGCKATILESKI